MSFRLPAPAPAVRVMLSFAFGLGNVLSFTDRFRVAAWRGTLAKRFASSGPPPHPISAGCARTAPERAADAPHSSHVCIPRPAQVSSTANSGPACLPRERPRQAHAHADRMTEAPGNQATQKHKKDGLRKIGDRPCVASSGPQNPVWPHYLFSSASAAFAGSSAGPAVTLPNAAMA